ncbi:NDR1/HIN1-like protein 6 [Brachypodium distachyon]|uniref:Late embryogenesis abundant protein LEA-2 subgroup domain-containing protein n=1 Tax=Brachypodium distachyon TaxID=15368 RepID=I1J3C8_BRADI|nr:NDR1/HIN1-like protein 6 [Brachypodium distachyon]KQJ85285.1 hypothetical protein BRADI_5g26160v3 [Brachypodium distachyon]|eukprot:XP_003580823.1 NDR1/HIN1-like protein 6 [Brachypodium distachyon]
MADYHRVHPVLAGSPLPAPEEKASKNSNHDNQQLPITAPRPDAPAPLRAPRRNSKRKHGRCCRCLCWTLLSLLILAIALGATAGILYAVFKPQIPKFNVDRLTATKFDVNTTSMVVTDAFEVQVTAENPNRRIGVYYLQGGTVSAAFNGTELCTGAFPALYQGHRSTVRPLVTLRGETRLDSEVAAQLARQQQAGFVPLTVAASVPIRIKFGVLKLWKMTGKARCSLVVDSIRPGTPLRIRSNSCSFKLKI